MQVHLVAVEVSIVGRANALVEAEGTMFKNLSTMGHDGEPVQRRLPVEQDNVAVNHVSLDDVTESQILSNFLSISVLEKFLHLDTGALHKVCSRMYISSVDDQLSKVL